MDDKQVGFILRDGWQRQKQRNETANKHGETEPKERVSDDAAEVKNHDPACSLRRFMKNFLQER
jgi:hypothetical protein